MDRITWLKQQQNKTKQYSKTIEFFCFKIVSLNLLNWLNYFATSICKGILQVVDLISTGVFNFFAQVDLSIFILTQVHNLYLYLLKEKTNLSKN